MTAAISAVSVVAAQKLFELSSDLLGVANPEGYFTSLNPAWERTLGFSVKALMAQPFVEFVHPDDRARTLAEAAALKRQGVGTVDFENRYARKTGGWVWLSWRTNVGLDGTSYFVARDVSARVAADHRRSMMASLVERIDDAILSKTPDGVITTWNRGAEELYGYTEAEAVGQSIQSLIIPPDRWDESDQIVRRLTRGEGVRQYTTERRRKDGSIVQVALTTSLIRDENDLVTGVAVVSRDLSQLDLSGTKAREIDAMSWIGRIREAIDEGRLVFFAQPMVGLAPQSLRHELLCRILDGDGEPIPAGRFIAAAESYGLIEEIDRRAITAATELTALGYPVSVNQSAVSVTRSSTASFIREEMARTGADPTLLTVELTETALVNDIAAATRFTQQIAALGSRIALDDFGTGFGGFTYLKRLHIDQLKIDIEFVRDLATSEASQNVVQSIVSLATRFGLETVAEGVEHEEALAMLRTYGVDLAQGHLVGPPAPSETLTLSGGQDPRLRGERRGIMTWVQEHLEDGLYADSAQRVLLQAAEEIGGLGSWAWEPATGRMLWSDNMFRLFGLRPQGSRPTVEYALSRIHADDRVRLQRVLAAASLGPTRRSISFRLLSSGGGIRWLEQLMVADHGQGERRVLVGCVRDTTERHGAEREIRAQLAVTTGLSDWQDMDTSAKTLLADLAQALEMDRAVLWIRMGDAVLPRAAWESDAAGTLPSQLRDVRLIRGQGPVGKAWQTREPVVVADLQQEKPYGFPKNLTEDHQHGAIAIPAVKGDEVLAVFACVGTQRLELTERLTATLAGIGRQLGEFFSHHRAHLEPTLLSPREQQLLQLAARGCSGPEIAKRLHLSPATVKSHFENIYRKCGVRDRAAAVAHGFRHGMIT